MKRQFPIGAEIQPDGGVHFRVWAPASPTVAVEFLPLSGDKPVRTVPLQAEAGGYFSEFVADARAGARYKFRLAGGAFPDPASRFQPDGPHGPSQIVSTAEFRWTDRDWRGLTAHDQVIYELHLGTFTRDGTWRAAMDELPELHRLGVTMIEVMPVADFPGRFGWGYDGVNLFAPCRLYGSPDDARAFVNRAHELGLGVILDVVYNHFGPNGNYIGQFSRDFVSRKHKNEWGDAINFDGENAAGVREFFVTNARYWIREFHFDGLRFDATQQLYDDSPQHVLAEIAAATRAEAGERGLYLVAENECQNADVVRAPEAGGHGLDAIWNDDWHHSAHVAATGRAEAYYSDFVGSAQEFVSAAKHGFLFQGQWFHWQMQRRGTPAFDLAPHQFIVFLQNHDQIANSLRGLRLHQLTSPGVHRALTALLCLGPQTPLLFQGQEFAASAPFLYFVDHDDELNSLVRQGRAKFLRQFRSIDAPESQAIIPDPADPRTFAVCQLDFGERETNRDIYHLHFDLLRLRREDKTIANPAWLDGAVLGEHAFVLRYFSAAADDRLLIVNLGTDLVGAPAPEPLLAPPAGRGWRTIWSSLSPEYGGNGTPVLETTGGWLVPSHGAFVLAPDENRQLPRPKLSEKD